MEFGNAHPIFVVLLVATLAPLLAEVPIGIRLPVTVLEILLGIVIGPSVLGIIDMQPGGFLSLMHGVGMAAVLLMAGMEIDFARVRGRPLLLGAAGWAVSTGCAFAVVGLLHVVPHVEAPMMVAIALSTTALGATLPILRDGNQLDQPFGRLLLGACTVGEVAPIIAVALTLSTRFSTARELGFLVGFLTLMSLIGWVAFRARPPRLIALLSRTLHASTQLPVRLSLLLLGAAYLSSAALGLEGILGAFAVGMVVGLATRGQDGKPFRDKLEAVCFGWLSPFFYVATGVAFSPAALLQDVTTMVLVPLFALLFLAVHAAPAWLLYRRSLPPGELWPFALYSSVPSLGLVITITTIGLHSGRMNADVAQALIGAALVVALVFPTTAALLTARSPSRSWTGR
jgi:Kef-type K+ transport system membrane component KefB